jgi:hypothetical protein
MAEPGAASAREMRRSVRSKLNAEENLLLLCNTHHHPVDSNESEYTIDQLLDWKKAQVTDSGGFLVGDEDVAGLAAALQASLDEIALTTRVQVQVRLVGGRIGMTGQVARMNLDGLDETEQTMGHLFRPGRLIGVEVENRGMVGADVQAAGIDIDHGPTQPGAWQYAFPDNRIAQWGFPCRADGHAARVWFEPEGHIRRFVDTLSAVRGLSPQRFRGWPSWAMATGFAVRGSPGRTCRSGNRASVRPSLRPGSAN